MKDSKNTILVILGPTATGKSDLAVMLAKKFNGEIISADSRQVYKGLNIGSGKISKKEMSGIRHFLLDVASPRSIFTAKKYQRLAKQAILKIRRHGKLPIICGGTGFYIDAVLDRIHLSPIQPNNAIRQSLATKNAAELLIKLKKLDPIRANSLNASDRVNPRRLIRAIEIASDNSCLKDESVHQDIINCQNIIYIGLNPSKSVLHKRIDHRLIKRLNSGMLDEARHLHRKGLSWKRMEELGLEYRYMSRHLRGQISKIEMIAQLSGQIRKYAKRQMTWFKKNKEIRWFAGKDDKRIVSYVKHSLNV